MQQATKFDAVIIGFGKGGKTLAAALGMAGRKTALIERSPKMYGGTCINTGCIPTKFLAHKSKLASLFEDKQAYYGSAIKAQLELTDRLRSKNLENAENTPNVTVITGTAKFLSPNLIEVQSDSGAKRIESSQIFINTGSVPLIPPIEGIKNTPYVVTSNDLLQQQKLPNKLVIIGGGYIGVEFASIYTNFGSKVTIIQNNSCFLPREDEDISNAVRNSLISKGIELLTEANVTSVSEKDGKAVLTVSKNSQSFEISADTVLIAVGRVPDTQGLGSENAGIALTERGGIVTDEHLQTSACNIYAMGDVTGGLQFTYISLDDFRIVSSAVLGNNSYTTAKRGSIPYSVFTDPPFSRVGMSEKEAKENGYTVKVARLNASAIPKALVMEQPMGMLKAIIDEKNGLILGAHLFCEESHEMINLIKLAIDSKLHYTKLRDMIFTHPTMCEALNNLFSI